MNTRIILPRITLAEGEPDGGTVSTGPVANMTIDIGQLIETIKNLIPKPELFLVGTSAFRELLSTLYEKYSDNILMQPVRTKYGFRCTGMYVVESPHITGVIHVRNKQLRNSIIDVLENRVKPREPYFEQTTLD